MSRRRVLAGLGASAASLAATSGAPAAPADTTPDLAARLASVRSRVIAWRRDIHRNPELGYRETRTSALVASHLRALGFDDVRTGLARTGVVGVLRGRRPGRTVALRADMDALPIREATGLPFASTATAELDGRTVPVMHACGHDGHTAMLMGAAQVLAGLRAQVDGTVLFLFQPAEEGMPGEPSSAEWMVRDGAFRSGAPDAVLALHLEPGRVGEIDARPGPFLSSASTLGIALTGRQTHGARPWERTDLISLTADIVQALNTLSARRVNVFETPSVITIAAIRAGDRANVLPGSASLEGTIRTFDAARLAELKRLITAAVQGLAGQYGAEAGSPSRTRRRRR